MRKTKKFVAIAVVAVVTTSGFFGYKAYEEANMTDAERMFKANLIALTTGEQPGGGNSSTYCYNGGAGSSSCSIDGGINILGYGVSAACSVSCNNGYYACCGIRCTCVKD